MTSAPRCPVHNLDMLSAVRWVSVDGRPFPGPCFTCPETGCLQIFDDIRGHFTEPEDAPIGQPLSLSRLKFLGR